jgi:uncharacterized protein YbaP (TraB family)
MALCLGALAAFNGRLRMSLRLALVGLFHLMLSWTTEVGAAKLAHLPPQGCPPALQIPSMERLEEARDQARNRGFLWRVYKGGRVSYLYGSLHVGKLAWAFPGPRIQEALRHTDVLALELDVQDPDIVESLQREFLARPPSSQLEAGLAERLQRQIDKACLPDEAKKSLADTYSPEMVLTTLGVTAARAEGLEAAYAADLAIGVWARQHRKQVFSLESAAVQVALLHAPNPEGMIAGLQMGLGGLENHSAQRRIRHLADLWADSRFDDLMRYSDWCECMQNPQQRAQMKRMLDDRNVGMAEKIDKLHVGGKRVFVAVGSLHMAGPMGLPSLLSKRGYRVQRVEFYAPQQARRSAL